MTDIALALEVAALAAEVAVAVAVVVAVALTACVVALGLGLGLVDEVHPATSNGAAISTSTIMNRYFFTLFPPYVVASLRSIYAHRVPLGLCDQERTKQLNVCPACFPLIHVRRGPPSQITHSHASTRRQCCIATETAAHRPVQYILLDVVRYIPELRAAHPDVLAELPEHEVHVDVA